MLSCWEIGRLGVPERSFKAPKGNTSLIKALKDLQQCIARMHFRNTLLH